ncbi:MAG: pilin [Patescibacteria group bacterium]
MKNLKLIIFSLFLLLSFLGHKAEAAVSLQLSALNISGVTATGTSTMPTFSLIINTNDLSDFSSTAHFAINIFDSYNTTMQTFPTIAFASAFITPQTGVLQQTRTIAITQTLTTNTVYYARVFYNNGTNLDFIYSNVVSFKFGDASSVNNSFLAASAVINPLSNGYIPIILTDNDSSGTESGKWWFKQTKDSEAKGPFSSITECETERAKGDSYSDKCFQFYYPLAPLPFQEGKVDTTSSDCPFGNYLNILIKLFIGICAVLAMIKIVIGGMQYMTSELASSKEDGKNSITSAVFGLILALGAFAILNTLNPQLLQICLNNLPKAVVQVEEIEKKISNQSGNGTCAVVTDQSSPCYPSKLASSFSGSTTASAPFNTLAAQASAICMLESGAKADMPAGLSPNMVLDKCSDNKPFSFGLFQINASAHRNDISACNGAFAIPTGHGTSQGNALEFYTAKNGTKYPSKWSCTTVEPAYTACKNYLTNPINNINFAATSTSLNRWTSWSTYNSCKTKF